MFHNRPASLRRHRKHLIQPRLINPNTILSACLNLNKFSCGRVRDVHIHFRPRIIRIIQIEQNLPIHQPHADRRQLILHRFRRPIQRRIISRQNLSRARIRSALPNHPRHRHRRRQLFHRIPHRHVRRRNTSRPCPTIRLQNLAIHRQRMRPDPPQINRRPKRPPNQPLNLRPPRIRMPDLRPRLPLRRRSRQHYIFRRHPAPGPLLIKPWRYLRCHRNSAKHDRLPLRPKHRPRRRIRKLPPHRNRPQLIHSSSIRSHKTKATTSTPFSETGRE